MSYTVSNYDTIPGIARKFGISESELMAYNNLNQNNFLFPGMIIIIPPRRPRPPQNRIYTVRRGDTIWSISRMFGVSVQNIMFTNNLLIPVVFPGQRLIIPQRFMPFY